MSQAPSQTTSDTAVHTLRKRLLFRSWHRGTREADLLMGGFAEQHLPEFSAAQLQRYEALLELSDPDLYNWMSGREPIPPDLDHDVMQMLVAFRPTPRPGG